MQELKKQYGKLLQDAFNKDAVLPKEPLELFKELEECRNRLVEAYMAGQRGECSEAQSDAIDAEVRQRAADLLNLPPESIVIDGDPRGAMLKFSEEIAKDRDLKCDFAGYGIAAPDDESLVEFFENRPITTAEFDEAFEQVVHSEGTGSLLMVDNVYSTVCDHIDLLEEELSLSPDDLHSALSRRLKVTDILEVPGVESELREFFNNDTMDQARDNRHEKIAALADQDEEEGIRI